MKLNINTDYRNLIPPITKEEYGLLEQSLINEGCREAIVTWNDVIIDGHNRYEMCKKHGIDFKVLEKEFDNEDEVRVWIIRNQLARRNLPPQERVRLALLLKPAIEEKAKEKQKKGGVEKVVQKSAEPSIKTREEVAKLAGVSHDTVHKVEIIEKEAAEEVKQAVIKGEISINKAYQGTKKTDPKSKNETKPEPREPEALSQLKRWWITASNHAQRRFLVWLKKEGIL